MKTYCRLKVEGPCRNGGKTIFRSKLEKVWQICSKTEGSSVIGIEDYELS
jgi:hypothetical protein